MKKAFFKKRVYTLMLAVIMVLATAVPAFAIEPAPTDWMNFRGNQENNGAYSFSAAQQPPTSEDEATLKWAVKYGEGWAACPTPPIIKGNFIFTAQGSRMLKLNKDTGELLSESPANDQLAGNVGYAMNNMVYVNGATAADDMIIVQIGNGQIQAVNANTLATLWKTDTANGVGAGINGQTISPLTAKKIGNTTYVYTGTWGGESSAYYCVTADMQNVNQSTKTKAVLWRHQEADAGFYWAGAYVNTNYVAYGSDNGKLYTKNPTTGAPISEVAVNGQVRSTPVFVGDNTSGAGTLYFTTKTSPAGGSRGQLCKVSVASNGTLSNPVKVTLSGMATGTPIVHNGKVYVGVCGASQFSPTSGHAFKVFDASTLAEVSTVASPGYPQAAGLLAEIGTQNPYVYFTYNAPPGGIKVFQDNGQETQTASDLYLPDADKQQYCISTIISDNQGTLYYKNDSCHLFAVQNSVQPVENPIEIKKPDGTLAEIVPYTIPNDAPKKAFVGANDTSCKVKLNIPNMQSATVNGVAYTENMTVNLDGHMKKIWVNATFAGGIQKTYGIDVYQTGNDTSLGGLTARASTDEDLAITYGYYGSDYEETGLQTAWTYSGAPGIQINPVPPVVEYVDIYPQAAQDGMSIEVYDEPIGPSGTSAVLNVEPIMNGNNTVGYRVYFDVDINAGSNVDSFVKIKVKKSGTNIEEEHWLRFPRAIEAFNR